MDSSSVLGAARRPSIIEDDDDVASLSDMEAGFSGNHLLLSKSSCYDPSRRRGSYRFLSRSSSSSSPRLYDARCEEHHHPHFLKACFLCKKSLGDNRDIFMYRGDTPFCSEECRQEQIEIDEAKEKNWKLSSSMKTLRKEQNKSPKNYQVRTSTVAAA
ncbi:hypothetical protein HHK36_028586 [Tetracentron sinense]|uniref:FLZ-type domain-containing protein n=1 Tax=Tetracentron sinense TaxID=13715 RepID=A0A834YG20_TETSI|nr:hypothetical protein HHK36_028586 [Tetracentron sinense]